MLSFIAYLAIDTELPESHLDKGRTFLVSSISV